MSLFLKFIKRSLFFQCMFFALLAGSVCVQVFAEDEEEEELIKSEEEEKKIIYVEVKKNDSQSNSDKNSQAAVPVFDQSDQQIEERPPTEVVVHPVSSDEKLMRARQDAERKTEIKIKERLESLRLRDEQKRLDQFLPQGDTGSTSSTTPYSNEPLPSVHHPSHPSSVSSAVEYIPNKRYFIKLGMGNLKYFYDRNGVDSSEVVSLGLGILEGKNMSFDFTFSYSKHRLIYEYDLTKNLFTHYNGSIALKYFLFPGRLKPSIGLLAAYNYRNYTGDRDYYWDGRLSQSMNVGVLGGFDFFIGSKFVVGMDARLYFNIYAFQDDFNELHSPYFNDYKVTPEELTLATVNIFAKLLF